MPRGPEDIDIDIDIEELLFNEDDDLFPPWLLDTLPIDKHLDPFAYYIYQVLNPSKDHEE